ncbi:unnamed protein product [Enterobius vermicularis]|uniref:PGG domain-containing protein n=1 Tax=Enterobius vermicularis TaxID=51028 RepID=A0A0N4UZX3_ENTVE|nr:unnamed protein product [Enterobius vermicularis]
MLAIKKPPNYYYPYLIIKHPTVGVTGHVQQALNCAVNWQTVDQCYVQDTFSKVDYNKKVFSILSGLLLVLGVDVGVAVAAAAVDSGDSGYAVGQWAELVANAVIAE